MPLAVRRPDPGAHEGYPFSTAAPLSQKAATAAVDLLIGIVIGSLVSGVAGRSIRMRQAREDTVSCTRGSSNRSQDI
jgi:hypothetical protein